MFENIVNQEATRFIASDVRRNILPRSILFSGNEADGKLSAALELSRVLSCQSADKKFNCMCPSCRQQKALVQSNLMLLGPRDCFLEIAAAKESFLTAVKTQSTHVVATQYLFLRSVRKLTLRFNGILWQGESNINKIGAVIESLNEKLEVLDFSHALPPVEELEEVCNKIAKECNDLEADYLYDSIPIAQIRNLESWARIKSEEGKKVIIIENADRMQTSVRNALLKILEEPPADVQFILLTNKRNAIMETILSRVRTYNFKTRNEIQQNRVLDLVFHSDYKGSINNFLMEFLPVTPSVLNEQATEFFNAIKNRKIPDVQAMVKKCGNFNPRIELRLFMHQLLELQKPLRTSAVGCEVSAEFINLLRKCWDNITLYNQTSVSAFEILLRDLSTLNVKNGYIFNVCGNQ